LLSTRSFHTATTLADARVLVAGGTGGTFVHRSAEIYDPATGDFTDTGEMAQFRFGHTATLMNDGRGLVTGGLKHQDRFIAEAEIYDPSTGEFAMTAFSVVSQGLSHVNTAAKWQSSDRRGTKQSL